MNTLLSHLRIGWIVLLLLVSCTTQSRYVALNDTYPPTPEDHPIELFPTDLPKRPFVKVARLDVHLEKSHFVSSDLDDALPELQKQARLSGSDAIIEVKERKSMVGETKIYHVTATGIKYTDRLDRTK